MSLLPQPLVYALAVGGGGALGALARWGASEVGVRICPGAVPVGTLFVNLLGSFLFGLMFGLLGRSTIESGSLQLAILTGFLGAFTTFSTFSFETLGLARTAGLVAALAYASISVLGGVALAWFGLRLTGTV